MVNGSWNSFVAIGDSFTEGLDDDLGPDARPIGWADRLAAALTVNNPEFKYANLAIRGRKLPEVHEEQLAPALAMKPDLLSFAAGGNDVLRPKVDPIAFKRHYETVVRTARESGADVLLFNFGDPSERVPALKLVSSRLMYLEKLIKQFAVKYDCMLVDLAAVSLQNESRFWAADRIHLNEEGHERVAGAALERLGLGDDWWREPLPPAPKAPPLQVASDDFRWAAGHLTPWINRRLRNTTSGADLAPKRPELSSIDPREINSRR